MSLFETIQSDVHERLLAHPYFADIPVELLRPRDKGTALQIEQSITESLTGLREKGGKRGASVMVLMPSAGCPHRGVPGPYLSAIVTVRVAEVPMYNMDPAKGTLKSAEQIALHVLLTLHLWSPGYGHVLTATERPIQPNKDVPGAIVYEVSLGLDAGIQPEVRWAAPAILGTAGAVEITGPAGAQLWYTTDGSFPRPDGATATLYTVPFALPEGADTVRAAAYADGKAGSDIRRLRF
ncbi:hypothetical protein DB346_08465 [Verrucomicrobia bacterium LW23]|nr:hypothetical protein DB346_08465 [Verrucomicrobia bacterium LW23]